MNELSTEIITEILSDDKAWDKKTRKLNYKWVIDAYEGERSYRFEEEVMLPRLLRAHRLFASWCGAELTEEGWLEDGMYSDWISEQLSDDMGIGYGIVPGLRERPYYRACYFEKIWESEKWAWEEISEGEILALGISPTQVPSKPGQPALF